MQLMVLFQIDVMLGRIHKTQKRHEVIMHSRVVFRYTFMGSIFFIEYLKIC